MRSSPSARSLQSQSSSQSMYLDADDDLPTPSADDAPVTVYLLSLEPAVFVCWSWKRAELADDAWVVPGAGRRSSAQRVYAWQVELKLWKPEDPRYSGTDTELNMKLTSFWFFCNRPTVAALMRLGSDMAAAARDGTAATPAPVLTSQQAHAVDQEASLPGVEPDEPQPAEVHLPIPPPACRSYLLPSNSEEKQPQLNGLGL